MVRRGMPRSPSSCSVGEKSRTPAIQSQTWARANAPAPQRAAGQVRDEPVGDADEREHHGACRPSGAGGPGTYAVLWTTRFTLNEARIRPPAPPKAKSTMASTCAASEGSPHGSSEEPREPPRSAPSPAADLERRDDVEEREQARKEHGEREQGVEELPPLVNAGVRVLVMDADRRGEEQEQDERSARHRIAQELAARLPRHQRVPGHVRGQEPEVHDRVTGEPEQCPGEQRVGPAHETERPGNGERRASRPPGPRRRSSTWQR